MWAELQGSPYLLEDGRLTDQFLLAVLIRVEFNGLQSGTMVYEGSLEALSHQYAGYGCHGGCTTLSEQLNWLDNMQGWYGRNGNRISINDCNRCLPDATRVMEGVEAIDGYAWWWGNPKLDSAMQAYINGNPDPNWNLSQLI